MSGKEKALTNFQHTMPAVTEEEEEIWMTPMEIISFLPKKDKKPTVHQQSIPLRACTPQTWNQQPEKKPGNGISRNNK